MLTKYKEGISPLFAAVMEDHTHAVKLLIHASANLEFLDPKTENNVLHLAAG